MSERNKLDDLLRGAAIITAAVSVAVVILMQSMEINKQNAKLRAMSNRIVHQEALVDSLISTCESLRKAGDQRDRIIASHNRSLRMEGENVETLMGIMKDNMEAR